MPEQRYFKFTATYLHSTNPTIDVHYVKAHSPQEFLREKLVHLPAGERVRAGKEYFSVTRKYTYEKITKAEYEAGAEWEAGYYAGRWAVGESDDVEAARQQEPPRSGNADYVRGYREGFAEAEAERAEELAHERKYGADYATVILKQYGAGAALVKLNAAEQNLKAYGTAASDPETAFWQGFRAQLAARDIHPVKPVPPVSAKRRSRALFGVVSR